MPVIPQKEAGWRIEPPVSVPVAAGASRAATATALPPDEPPGMRDVSHGFLAGRYAEFSLDEPIANSSQLSLPKVTAPAPGPCPGAPWPSLATTEASNGER